MAGPARRPRAQRRRGSFPLSTRPARLPSARQPPRPRRPRPGRARDPRGRAGRGRTGGGQGPRRPGPRLSLREASSSAFRPPRPGAALPRFSVGPGEAAAPLGRARAARPGLGMARRACSGHGPLAAPPRRPSIPGSAAPWKTPRVSAFPDDSLTARRLSAGRPRKADKGGNWRLPVA